MKMTNKTIKDGKWIISKVLLGISPYLIARVRIKEKINTNRSPATSRIVPLEFDAKFMTIH
jgi:hypothetical protein